MSSPVEDAEEGRGGSSGDSEKRSSVSFTHVEDVDEGLGRGGSPGTREAKWPVCLWGGRVCMQISGRHEQQQLQRHVFNFVRETVRQLLPGCDPSQAEKLVRD